MNSLTEILFPQRTSDKLVKFNRYSLHWCQNLNILSFISHLTMSSRLISDNSLVRARDFWSGLWHVPDSNDAREPCRGIALAPLRAPPVMIAFHTWKHRQGKIRSVNTHVSKSTMLGENDAWQWLTFQSPFSEQIHSPIRINVQAPKSYAIIKTCLAYICVMLSKWCHTKWHANKSQPPYCVSSLLVLCCWHGHWITDLRQTVIHQSKL